MTHFVTVLVLSWGAGVAACASETWKATLPSPVFSRDPVAGGIPQAPVIAVDSRGYVHVAAWVKDPVSFRWDIALRTKPPGGVFGSPVRISYEDRPVVFGSQPRLAITTNDVVLIAWPAVDTLVRWSTDRGATWSAPVTINQGISSVEVDLTMSPTGAIHVLLYGQVNGQSDLFYTRTRGLRTPTLGGSKFTGIDPEDFLPMRAITSDAQTNPLFGISADEKDRAYIAWMNPGAQCNSLELDVVTAAEIARFNLPCFSEGQVASSRNRGTAILFSEQEVMFRVNPFLMFANGRAVTFPRPVPATGAISRVGDARCLHYGGNGFVAMVLLQADEAAWDYWVEAFVTRDHGLTFSPALRVGHPPPPMFRSTAATPALAVDESENLHIAYMGDASGSLHILYCTARYD